MLAIRSIYFNGLWCAKFVPDDPVCSAFHRGVCPIFWRVGSVGLGEGDPFAEKRRGGKEATIVPTVVQLGHSARYDFEDFLAIR